ncbi:protein spinster homolog 1-like [Symsagittifera roscoffensis]|uniref:protein spinster homolog 1-like n=1 Tax=Symsagittifera roscoffensis TaxID=84072 RepID=UPI00307CA75D
MPDIDYAELSVSNHHLFATSVEVSNRLAELRREYSITRRILTAVILSLLNIVNFFDRSIYGVVLPAIKESFQISNSQAGLIQTLYVVSIIVAAPMAGVIGRRFSRKWAIIVGSIAWCAAVICGPLFCGDSFTLFCLIRACAGIGESFLGTLAITIFADLFNEKYRPLVLNVFMGGILLGGSLAYLLGPLVSEHLADVWGLQGWVWVTSGTGVVGAVFLIPAVFIVPDVPMQSPAGGAKKKGSMAADLKYMFSCKSYIFTVIGYTCFSFTLGSKQYWDVTFITYSSYVNSNINLDEVINIIALIVFVCGWLGSIGLGEFARFFKNRGYADAQPVTTGIVGMFSGLTFLGYMRAINYSVPLSLTFFGLTSATLCAYVATFQDLIMSTLPPQMRPLGAGMATLIGHLLGDGFASLIIGAISDWYASGRDNTYEVQAESLITAFHVAQFISTIGGMFFIGVALTLRSDLKKCRRFVKRKGASAGTQPKEHTEGNSDELKVTGTQRSSARSSDPFVPLDDNNSPRLYYNVEEGSGSSEQEHSNQ